MRISDWSSDVCSSDLTELPKVDLIVIPGGFSYGDYLRCGAIAAHSPVMREVVARAKAGAAVLGVCNGFQILAETGQIGRASCRERVCQYVWISVVAVSLNKKKKHQPDRQRTK